LPRPSAFNSTHFSSRPPHGELIYKQMVADLGSGENFSDDFDSIASARIYANAMTFARAKYALERAGSQFRPSRTLELLPALEAEYGIVPEPDATTAERRSELAVAMRIARGANRVNVEEILTALLGDDFVSYETIDAADAVQTAASPEDEGIYVTPGTERSVYTLTDSVLFTGTPVTVGYEFVTGAREELSAGDVIIVDAGNHGRIEPVTITSATASTLTATFTKPHTSGVQMATGRHPYLMSSKRHNVFVLSEDGMASARTQTKANRTIRRMLRGVSTWALTDSTDAFTVGEGLLGVTLIGEDDLSGDPVTTGLLLDWDMSDPDSYVVTPGSPDRVTTLTNTVSAVDTTEATFGPEFEELGWGGGLHCMKLNGSDMRMIDTEPAVLAAVNGASASYTVYIVCEPLTLDANAAYFGVGHSAKASNQSTIRVGTRTTGNGRRGIVANDDAMSAIAQEAAVDLASGRQVWCWSVSGTTATGFTNDGSADPSSGSFSVGTVAADRFALGCLPCDTPTFFANARVAEIKLYSDAHSNVTAAQEIAYLLSKWDV
jgi:hypothetical protein